MLFFNYKKINTDIFTFIQFNINFPVELIYILQDSVYVLASAIKEMLPNETITEAPKDCDDSGTIWETGD